MNCGFEIALFYFAYLGEKTNNRKSGFVPEGHSNVRTEKKMDKQRENDKKVNSSKEL